MDRRLWTMCVFACFLSLAVVVGCGKNPDLQAVPPVARLLIEPQPVFDFGSIVVSESRDQEFRIQNTGGVVATKLSSSFGLSLHFSYLGGAYPGDGGTCDDALEVGEACTVKIRFSPAYSAEFLDILRVEFFDGSSFRGTEWPLLKGSGRTTQ